MPHFPAPPGFRFVRRLGANDRAIVYEAEMADGCRVAVKVLTPAAAANPGTVTRFRRELAAGHAVRHPHLVRVHDGSIDRQPYLVMDLVGGDTLARRLDRRGRVTPVVALGIARQLAEALAALHAAGLVHGDVKPANVVLPAAGRAVLVDLGFAHRPGEIDVVLGTPNYLAPELCRTPAVDTPAADLFALGVTLFESLTGRLPFASGSRSGAMVAHRDNEPDRLTDYPGRWSNKITSFVNELMTPDPFARPTAKEAGYRIAELQIESLKRAA
jgi:serine/threonine protein kinase